jgi:hypothetical protein
MLAMEVMKPAIDHAVACNEALRSEDRAMLASSFRPMEDESRLGNIV